MTGAVAGVDEHAVVLTLNLTQGVAKGFGEVLVGVEDGAVQRKFDDGLGLADRGQLAFVIGGLLLGSGDVGGVLDHLKGLALQIEDRVVGRLNPDLAAILGEPLVLAHVKLAAAQLGPERLVFGATALARRDKHRVVLALNLIQRIPHHLQKVFVGVEDVAFQVELDHRLRLADGAELTGHIGGADLDGGDVSCVFDDLEGFAVWPEDGVVGRLDPHFAATLGQSAVLRGVEVATPEFFPELAVFEAAALFRQHEDGMMLAQHFLGGVAHRFQEVVVGLDDGAVQLELDHRLRAVDGRELAFDFGPVQGGLGDGKGTGPGPGGCGFRLCFGFDDNTGDLGGGLRGRLDGELCCA